MAGNACSQNLQRALHCSPTDVGGAGSVISVTEKNKKKKQKTKQKKNRKKIENRKKILVQAMEKQVERDTDDSELALTLRAESDEFCLIVSMV